MRSLRRPKFAPLMELAGSLTIDSKLSSCDRNQMRLEVGSLLVRHLVVLGAGEFARQIMEILHTVNREKPRFHLLGFLDRVNERKITDLHILGGDEQLASLNAEYLIGVGSPRLRRKLGTMAEDIGSKPAMLVHPAAWIDRDTEVGPGALVAGCAHIQYGARVGRHVIVNIGAIIGHDCQVGDYSSVAGNVMIGARARIGDDVFVGMNSVVMSDVKVGDRAVIGAGAVVTKDVPADTCVVGVPARPLKSTS